MRLCFAGFILKRLDKKNIFIDELSTYLSENDHEFDVFAYNRSKHFKFKNSNNIKLKHNKIVHPIQMKFSFNKKAALNKFNGIENEYSSRFKVSIENARIELHAYAISFNKYISETRPDLVVIWHQFNPVSKLIHAICLEKKIKTIFIEYGVIPGTVNYDIFGQMGESIIATNVIAFNELKLKDEFRISAQDFIKKFNENRFSRHLPILSESVKDVLLKKNVDKPIVFYAGQNDIDAGLIPRNEKSKKFHSPIFCDTLDAFYSLYGKTEADNSFHLLFKPHPNYTRIARDLPDNENCTIKNDGDIFEFIEASEVVITIVSQVAYLAALMGKKVLMLGNNQIIASQLVKRISNRENLGEVLNDLIKANWDLENAKFEFSDHIARLLQYYSFKSSNKIKHGRGIDFLVKEFVSISNNDENGYPEIYHNKKINFDDNNQISLSIEQGFTEKLYLTLLNNSLGFYRMIRQLKKIIRT